MFTRTSVNFWYTFAFSQVDQGLSSRLFLKMEKIVTGTFLLRYVSSKWTLQEQQVFQPIQKSNIPPYKKFQGISKINDLIVNRLNI